VRTGPVGNEARGVPGPHYDDDGQNTAGRERELSGSPSRPNPAQVARSDCSDQMPEQERDEMRHVR